MGAMSRRECHLYESSNDEITNCLEELRLFLKKRVPEGYTVDVFKDEVVCCGYMSLGIVVEITGLERQLIEKLDSMICSRIVKICEREKISSYEFEQLDIIEGLK